MSYLNLITQWNDPHVSMYLHIYAKSTEMKCTMFLHSDVEKERQNLNDFDSADLGLYEATKAQ